MHDWPGLSCLLSLQLFRTEMEEMEESFRRSSTHGLVFLPPNVQIHRSPAVLVEASHADKMRVFDSRLVELLTDVSNKARGDLSA